MWEEYDIQQFTPPPSIPSAQIEEDDDIQQFTPTSQTSSIPLAQMGEDDNIQFTLPRTRKPFTSRRKHPLTPAPQEQPPIIEDEDFMLVDDFV